MKGTSVIIGIMAGLCGLVILPAAHAVEPLQVTVSIQPQKYFVEKIGGERVAVTVMVEPGAEPHVYDPKPQQMASLAKSKIYFALGVPFEDTWLERFASASPGMQIVHTEAGIQKLPMAAHEHHDDRSGAPHQHRPKPTHSHHQEVLDPHVWLSPPLVMIQARNILSALVQVDPSQRSLYEQNYRKFLDELVSLDLDLLRLFGEGGRREFMVFHPAWGYFAVAYGLEQTPIEVEGKEPKAADLKRLIEHAREHRVKALFVQPQFSATSAEVIAEALGAQLVAADPMASDWATNLRQVAEKFRVAIN